MILVRLACLIHAASVRPEPVSYSPKESFSQAYSLEQVLTKFCILPYQTMNDQMAITSHSVHLICIQFSKISLQRNRTLPDQHYMLINVFPCEAGGSITLDIYSVKRKQVFITSFISIHRH